MEPFVHTLNRKEHKSFLEEKRYDPSTLELITDGDRVVVCAGLGCESVHLLSSWNNNDRKCPICKSENTLNNIPPKHINRIKKPRKKNDISKRKKFAIPQLSLKGKIIILTMLCIFIGYTVSMFFIAPIGIKKGNLEVIKIEHGMGLSQISDILKNKGLINNTKYFVVIGKVLGYEKKLKSGTYYIQTGASHFKLLKTLVEGKTGFCSITIPEGAATIQIIDIFEKSNLSFDKKEFLHLIKDHTFINSLDLFDFQILSLDGFLYPETYLFKNYVDTKTIIKTLVDQFIQSWKKNNCDILFSSLYNNYFKTHRRLIRLTKYDIVILASIVDDLVNLDKTKLMPDVAQIYYNRIIDHERFYLKSQNKDINQYTRSNYGLPNMPLNNPGIQAIVAALKPAKHGYTNLTDIGIK